MQRINYFRMKKSEEFDSSYIIFPLEDLCAAQGGGARKKNYKKENTPRREPIKSLDPLHIVSFKIGPKYGDYRPTPGE